MLSQTEIDYLIWALKGNDSRTVNRSIVKYIKYSGTIKYREIIDYLDITKDISSAVEIIFGLSNRGFRSNDFSEEILKFFHGVPWDFEGDLKLAALLVLPKHVPCDENLKILLRQTYISGNSIFRDAVLVAAQFYFGIAPENIKHGGGDGNLARELTPDVLAWLGGVF